MRTVTQPRIPESNGAAETMGTDAELRTFARKPTRIQMVLDWVKAGVSTGRFKPDTRLPTEAEIAMELGISRTPVREAVKILDALGVLEVRVGAGTFVRPGLQPSLSQILLFQLFLQQTTPRKLMEARRLVERGCAELAAEYRSEEDLADMRAAIVSLESCAERADATPEEMLEADLDFHRAVFQATHNELASAIANFVLDMVAPWIRQTLQITGPKQAASMHRAEYTMIEAGNAGAARESVVLAAVDRGMEHWLKGLRQGEEDD